MQKKSTENRYKIWYSRFQKSAILYFQGGNTLDIEKITSLEQLSGEQRELAEIVGLEVYNMLIENFGGCQMYIPKRETIFKNIRNKEIKKDFNGFNYRELAKKYNLSEKTVRKIISEK